MYGTKSWNLPLMSCVGFPSTDSVNLLCPIQFCALGVISHLLPLFHNRSCTARHASPIPSSGWRHWRFPSTHLRSKAMRYDWFQQSSYLPVIVPLELLRPDPITKGSHKLCQWLLFRWSAVDSDCAVIHCHLFSNTESATAALSYASTSIPFHATPAWISPITFIQAFPVMLLSPVVSVLTVSILHAITWPSKLILQHHYSHLPIHPQCLRHLQPTSSFKYYEAHI